MVQREDDNTARATKTNTENFKMNGYIAVHRKIFENPIIKPRRPYSKFEAWHWLMMRANYSEHRVPLGTEVIHAKRGEVITSQKKLGAKFGWGNTKVRNFLKLLENDTMIVLKTTPNLTRITLCNYESYQIQQTDSKSKATQPQRTTKSQTNTKNKENKKNKKNKNNNINTDDNKNRFVDEIFNEEMGEKYGKQMLDEFFIFYSEPTQDGKQMKFQTFKTWSTAGRLHTWSKNDYNGCYQQHKNWQDEQRKKQEIKDSKISGEIDPEGQAKYIKGLSNKLVGKIGV